MQDWGPNDLRFQKKTTIALQLRAWVTSHADSCVRALSERANDAPPFCQALVPL